MTRPRVRRDLYVVVAVTAAGDKHCSNDCDWMVNGINEPTLQRCSLFGNVELAWDKRRKQDGYKRCRGCRDSEERTL